MVLKVSFFLESRRNCNMPSFCAVVGCGSRGNRDKKSFFSIPCIPVRGRPEMIALKTERRIRWILALRRKDLTESKLRNETICERHFISGRPAATRDVSNPDWVPSQNMGYELKPSSEVYGNQTTTKAVISYVKPHVQQQVEKRTESDIGNQDEDSQSRIESSSFIQIDQHKKEEKNRGAIIYYIKTNNLEQIQEERTDCQTIDLDKNLTFRNELTSNLYSRSQQTDQSQQTVYVMRPYNHQQIVRKRAIDEIIDENRDSKKLKNHANLTLLCS